VLLVFMAHGNGALFGKKFVNFLEALAVDAKV
jgi:hypothetical protein